MATCEMKDHIENNNCNKYALDFELLLALDRLDEQYELVCPDSLNPSLDSQGQDQDQFLEDFCILSADILLPGTMKEEINDLKNSASLFTEDTSSMQEKEGKMVQKRKYADLSFLDELDIEEPSVKRPAIDDTEVVNPSAMPKVQIIKKKSRKVEPSLLIQLLKGLSSKKALEYWMNICNEYLNSGWGLCCNNNCWMAWEYVDIKTILSAWL